MAYQFEVGLSDLLSNPFAKLAERVDAGFGAMQTKLDKFNSKWTTTATRVSNVDRMLTRFRNQTSLDRHIQSADKFNHQLEKLSKYRNSLDINIDTREIRAANREIERLEGRLNSLHTMGRRGGRGGMLGGALGMAGRAFLPLMAGAAIVGGGWDIAQKGMEREQTLLRYRLMAGKEQGGALVGQLNKYADQTPFENKEIIGAGQMMLPVFKSNEIAPRIKMLGNIAAGTGVELEELSRSYVKAKNAYFVQNDTLEMFLPTGVNKQLAKLMKVPEAKIKKLAEQNKITFDTLDKALYQMQDKGGLFAGMTDQLGQTSGGKLSTLTGTFNEQLTQMGLRTLPTVNKGMEMLNTLMAAAGDENSGMGKATNVGGKLWEVLGKIDGTLGAMVGKESALKSFFGMIGDQIDKEVNTTLSVWEFHLTNISTLLDKTKNWIKNDTGGAPLVYGGLGGMYTTPTKTATYDIQMPAAERAKYANHPLAQKPGDFASSLVGGIPGLGKPLTNYKPKTAQENPFRPGNTGGGAGGGIGEAAGLGSTVAGSQSKHITVNIQSVVGATNMNVAVASLRDTANELNALMHEEIQRTIHGALAIDNGATD